MSDKHWLEGVGDKNIEQLIQLEDTYRIDSIVVAVEAALLKKPTLTSAERTVLVVEAMEREVNNGGFNQFFYNSSNEYALELVSALNRIGVPRSAEIAERALRAIGAKPNWTSEQFEEASVEPNEATEAELSACDEAYYDNEEEIAEKLLEFIKSNHKNISVNAGSA